jgi:hypothetical protein
MDRGTKMKLFRIYTENKNMARVVELAFETFAEGFSVFTGQGYWAGVSEPGLVLEIVVEEEQRPLVLALADSIKIGNRQQCVMVTSADVEVTFV